MTYQQTLDYLYSQLPMYQRQGKSAFKKDLTNISGLMSRTGEPHRSLDTIHIAGTNGKGTTAHLIASVLQTMGMKVGLYTSPHYLDFRERIKIDGEYISEEAVVAFAQMVKDDIVDIQPSFFEITVAMAFEYFRDQEVDIAVIETGLGGRLDSTNIITPLLSVITNISLDHQYMLGPDIYTIAGEKAGIIKPNIPVVIGKYQASCDHVFFKKAKACTAPISFASIDHPLSTYDIRVDDSVPFLEENANTALTAMLEYARLSTETLDLEVVQEAFTHFRSITHYSGRWQKLYDQPLMIADSAHNEDALRQVLDTVRMHPAQHKHFVLGFVSDKDVSKILNMFPVDQEYYFTCPQIPRGMPIDQLENEVSKTSLNGAFFQTVESAMHAALESAAPDDLIYVGGSSFVVADALAVDLS